MNPHHLFRRQLLVVSMLLPMLSLAQEKAPAAVSYFSNALFNTLLLIIIVLLILIAALGSVLKNLAGSELLRNMRKKDERPGAGKATLLVLMLGLGLSMYGQDNTLQAVPQNDWRIGGIEPFTFYFMMAVIGMELIVTGILISSIKNLLAIATPEKTAVIPAQKPKEKPLLDKLNAAVDVAEEESILLDHNYDGIRELDNDLPPWWKYGFYLTIVVSVVYMIHYHVTKTAPLQAEEYTQSVKKAEAEIAEFMKNSANNIDETTVKLLTDPAALASGKDLFIANCAACHGKLGEGTVGPNLTDDYWLHAGGVKDIFKTIKYGWPDKGMKAWKEDFSPVQIAQLTSFIKTLRGSNPPKAKEQQGDLYVEESNVATDSTTTAATDSLKIVMAPDSTKK